MISTQCVHFVRAYHQSRFGEVMNIIQRFVLERKFSGTPVGRASVSMNAHRNGAKSRAETLDILSKHSILNK